jgi:hypothetical protein
MDQARFCGYSAGRPLAEVWEINLMGDRCSEPSCIQAEQESGLPWDGEYEALDRLIFGLGIVDRSRFSSWHARCRVLLHAGYGLLSAWTDERMAILAARDSGMGIPAEAPAQAFDLFTQLKQRVPHAQGALEIG